MLMMIVPRFGIFVLSIFRVKEFCSPNCSVKSGRRNTVENFDLLPNFVEVGASAQKASSARYHTLPHHLATAAKNKSKTANPVKEDSPPKVPPHRNLSAESPR